MSNPYIQTMLIILPLILLVMFLRVRSVTEPWPLKLELLWILPVIYLGLTIWILAEIPPEPAIWGWLAIGLLFGGVLGWYRGKSMVIAVDPKTRAMSQSGAPIAIFILMALVVLRFAMRFPQLGLGSLFHLDSVAAIDVFMLFACGLVIFQRVEMWLRGNRILAETVAVPAP